VATVSPITSIPLPVSTDTDQVPADLMTAATYFEKMLVAVFANTAARSAKITAPTAGMLTWLSSPGRIEQYNGTAWVPLVPAKITVGNAIIGTNWDGVSQLLELNTTFVTTPTAGAWTYTFPTAFPNGIISMQATPGDNASSLGQVQTILSTSSLSTYGGGAFTVTGTAINGLAVRVTISVIGW
jgi:hypothetical protein